MTATKVDWVVPTLESTDPPPSGSSDSVIGAIPARFASSRLPGKPLRLLAGRPLIEHVYRQAAKASHLSRVIVLTDDQRIFDTVVGFGGEAEMTPVDCASGTDRIASAADGWDATAIINIQGDEPLIEPQAIDQLAVHLTSHPEDLMVTLATEAGEGEAQNPNVVKVVIDLTGSAMYFSRAPIPHRRGDSAYRSLRHIGIYGYQRQTLLDLAALPPSELERCESLEQLRALDHGIRIRVLEVERAWQGVDTMEDLERVESILKQTVASAE